MELSLKSRNGLRATRVRIGAASALVLALGLTGRAAAQITVTGVADKTV